MILRCRWCPDKEVTEDDYCGIIYFMLGRDRIGACLGVYLKLVAR